ncbi:MAG: HyaD/HybD family hydrogenase maturation endopeptidase [Magnetospirillum sp.]|nr:HyaD/HybD family hydrogenase maturation endopeptidase [Magnetospirillum sp.]
MIPSSSDDGRWTLVLGVGNILWADEGTGPRLVDALRQRVNLPSVEMIDGGTQGLYLLPMVTACSRLLLLDAVDMGRPAGEVVVLEGDAIVTGFGTRVLSLHQTSLHDLLAAAELLGWTPDRRALVGIQALDTETWGAGLTPPVAAALDAALDRAEEILVRWEETPPQLPLCRAEA